MDEVLISCLKEMIRAKGEANRILSIIADKLEQLVELEGWKINRSRSNKERKFQGDVVAKTLVERLEAKGHSLNKSEKLLALILEELVEMKIRIQHMEKMQLVMSRAGMVKAGVQEEVVQEILSL